MVIAIALRTANAAPFRQPVPEGVAEGVAEGERPVHLSRRETAD